MRLYIELTRMKRPEITQLMEACIEDGMAWADGCAPFTDDDDPAGILILDMSTYQMTWDEFGMEADTFRRLSDKLSGRWLDTATMGGTA